MIVLFSKRPGQLWNPPSLLLNGHPASFLACSEPGRDVDHAPPSMAEMMNERSCSSAPPYMPSRFEQGLYLFIFCWLLIFSLRHIQKIEKLVTHTHTHTHTHQQMHTIYIQSQIIDIHEPSYMFQR